MDKNESCINQIIRGSCARELLYRTTQTRRSRYSNSSSTIRAIDKPEHSDITLVEKRQQLS